MGNTFRNNAKKDIPCGVRGCSEIILEGEDFLMEYSQGRHTAICKLCQYDDYSDYDETEERW